MTISTRPAQTTDWLVVRLNYADPLELFLAKSLKPFVNTLVQAGIVDRYFWQRGTERGTHIRLAMRGNEQILYELVLPNLGEHFFRYVEDMPSIRYFDNETYETNNSIQTEIYAPNAEDIGGDIGQPIFERFEEASSDAVLAFMLEKHNIWSSFEAATTAIQMHLGFINSAGLTAIEAAQLCEYYLKTYIKEPFSLQLFERVFKKNERVFFDFHAKMWYSLRTSDPFSEPHYNKWLEQCYFAAQDLKYTFRTRKLTVEPRFVSLWQLYGQLFKATNQRLGLKGRQEALVFYVMLRAIEKIAEE